MRVIEDIRSSTSWLTNKTRLGTQQTTVPSQILDSRTVSDNTRDVMMGVVVCCRRCLANRWLVSYWRSAEDSHCRSSVDCIYSSYNSWVLLRLMSRPILWIGDSLYASKDCYRSLSGLRWRAGGHLCWRAKERATDCKSFTQLCWPLNPYLN